MRYNPILLHSTYSYMPYIVHSLYSVYSFSGWLWKKERQCLADFFWSVMVLFFKARVKANQTVSGRELWKPQLTKLISVLIINYIFFKFREDCSHSMASGQVRKESRAEQKHSKHTLPKYQRYTESSFWTSSPYGEKAAEALMKKAFYNTESSGQGREIKNLNAQTVMLPLITSNSKGFKCLRGKEHLGRWLVG